MNDSAFVTKSRNVWDIRALQLLREKKTAQYAAKTVPRLVQGVCIEFPNNRVSLGLRVEVKSRQIPGRKLLDLIRDHEMHDLALNLGMIALEALHNSNVASDPFGFFRRAFGYVRKQEIALAEMLGPAILSRKERMVLYRIASAYAKSIDGGKAVLVHGDLHPSNVIVDPVRGSLGFVDLEMMHIGKPVTNFAQLWIGFQFENPYLGQQFYKMYVDRFQETVDDEFDTDIRAEIALRCYSMIRDGKRYGDVGMEEKSRALIKKVLTWGSFEAACLS